MVIEQAKMLLESNGIPVYISNSDTARNVGYIVVVGKLGLWVALEYHYQDAKILLENSEHEVSRPVNVGAYYAEIDELRVKNVKRTHKRIMSVVVFLVALGVGFYFYSKIAG